MTLEQYQNSAIFDPLRLYGTGFMSSFAQASAGNELGATHVCPKQPQPFKTEIDEDVKAVCAKYADVDKYRMPKGTAEEVKSAYLANKAFLPDEPPNAPSSWSWGAVFSRISGHEEWVALDKFITTGFPRAYIDEKPCKSAGASDLVPNSVILALNKQLGTDSHQEQGTKAEIMQQWDDLALTKFQTLRVLGLALAPYDKLSDGLWLAQQGLIMPHIIAEKDEPTKTPKVEDDSGKPLELQRWRTLKVQTFEDGLLARILTQAQTSAEKKDLACPHAHTNTPVLAGVGHVGTGEELFWKHFSACAESTSSIFHNSASLGDDFSSGNAGSLFSSDFSAFDETATLARFRLTALTFVHGASQCKVNPLLNSAILGYHEALAHQPALVAGYLVPGRSGWPSAIPHTTYGDSVAATAAGIETVVRRSNQELGGQDNHSVICKQVLVGDQHTGVEALSCLWSTGVGSQQEEVQAKEEDGVWAAHEKIPQWGTTTTTHNGGGTAGTERRP